MEGFTRLNRYGNVDIRTELNTEDFNYQIDKDRAKRRGYVDTIPESILPYQIKYTSQMLRNV